VLIVVSSLLDSWEGLRAVVTNSVGKTKLNCDDIRNLILSEEIRKKDTKSVTDSNALTVQSKGRGRTFNKRSNHGRSKLRNPKEMECYFSHEKGQIKYDCPKLKSFINEDKNNNREKVSNSTNIITLTYYDDSGDDHVLTVTCSKDPIDGWVLDSGCTIHICPHKDCFSIYELMKVGVFRPLMTRYSKL